MPIFSIKLIQFFLRRIFATRFESEMSQVYLYTRVLTRVSVWSLKMILAPCFVRLAGVDELCGGTPSGPAENMGAVSGAPLSRDIVLRLPSGRRPAPPIPLLHVTFPRD